MSRTPWILTLLVVLAAGRSPSLQEPADAGKLDYYRDIRPILAVHCYRCHSKEVRKGKLRLDEKAVALKSLVPGRSGESELYRRIASTDPDERMPSKGEPLSGREIDLLKRWIDQGAEWGEDASTRRSHWAFQPVKRPEIPAVKNAGPSTPLGAGWVRTPVDAFVARGHEARGLVPAPEASGATLIRRLSLDLTGLPPGPGEVRAFLEDGSERAYEKLVDRLLESPHYGERWGRHWLDLARFAESSDYEANALRESAWRYRDYVVRSFNEDKPYDLFLRQQIAGDEMSPLTDETLIATGFLAHGRLDNNQENRAIQRNDHLVDIVNATGNVVFGLSIGCAQCHAHKWDPITAEDYYRFMGFFIKGQVNNLILEDPEAWKRYRAAIPRELEPTKKYLALLTSEAKKRLVRDARSKLSDEERKALDTAGEKRSNREKELAAAARKKLEFNRDRIRKASSQDDRKLFEELEKKIKRLEKKMPRKPHAWGFYSPASSPHKVDTLKIRGFYPMKYDPDQLRKASPKVLHRGDPHQAGKTVGAGWPAVLGPTPENLGERTRTALVEWLTRPDHPLTARVFVNYVWQQHFGKGIVATAGDFGLRGEKPSHPGLLDWLASEFARKGWSVKRLHRLIVLSSTYRQASRPHAKNEAIDRENRYLWRWSPRRLEAEAVRDSLLAVSGELDRTLGGKSIKEKPGSSDTDQTRRSIYYLQKRHDFPSVQEFFDGPRAGECCPKRYVSTVSLQSLYLINGPFAFERARAFAARVRKDERDDRERQVRRAFELALSRPPTRRDLEDASAFLDRYGKDPARGLDHLCHALMNLNEFVYVQ